MVDVDVDVDVGVVWCGALPYGVLRATFESWPRRMPPTL